LWCVGTYQRRQDLGKWRSAIDDVGSWCDG
jgi:hypothetical protein